MKTSRPAALCLALALPLALAACGGDDDSEASEPQAPVGQETTAAADEAVAAPTLGDDGPGACFDLIADHLGGDAKVHEIDSNFSAGEEIKPQLVNPEETPEVGVMTHCSVKYQDPDDANKLLESRLDLKTGTFSDPAPMEITVMGDAAGFKLDDYVVALSAIDTTPVEGVMQGKESELDGAFSTWAWTGLDLSAPDMRSPEHALRLDASGRLASNDIVEDGYLELSIDGKTVGLDNLLP